MRRTAALIVGGGPAGAAAAIGLARAGAMPVLIERSAGERDVVCGGFLGWDALARLRQLGPRPGGAWGAADPSVAAGGAATRSSSRRCRSRRPGSVAAGLDAALLRLAEAEGAVVLRGRAARAAEGRSVRLDDGEEIEADALFVATGKHELRGVAREMGGARFRSGCGRRFLPRPRWRAICAGVIELHLYDGGYAGLLLQEDGMVNLCLSVGAGADGRRARRAARRAAGENRRASAERIGAAPAEWEAIAGVPYGWRAKATEPGVYRVGDQAAVIASLAGDGIAIALASGIAAAQACLHGDGRGARAYQKAFARRAMRPVNAAEALRHMAEHRGERRVMMGWRGSAGLPAWRRG